MPPVIDFKVAAFQQFGRWFGIEPSGTPGNVLTEGAIGALPSFQPVGSAPILNVQNLAASGYVTVAGVLAIGPATDINDQDGFGSIQLTVNRTVTGDPGFAAGLGAQVVLNTGDSEAGTVFENYYFDADAVVANHLGGLIGHDNSQHVTLSGGAVIDFLQQNINDLHLSGTGTVTGYNTNSAFIKLVGAHIGDGVEYQCQLPDLSGGAQITGTWYSIKGDDISSLVTGGAKGFINYAGVFIVDSAGQLSLPGGATLLHALTALTSGPGVGAGTLTNAPSAGNPTKWIAINDGGTTRHIPAW